jgi:WD40 repeat protein/DNA-binding SARP family transcriptional activator/tRNA A-37 threonylcarbamoyl transferase component Bud32
LIRFHALGGVMVTADGREVTVGGPRQRRLLTMLLIHRNEVVSADRLTDAVFAGEPTPGAATTMRSYIARVRKVVQVNGSGAAVVTQAPGYRLQVPDDAYDVARFETGLAEGRALLSRDDPVTAAAVLAEALALWRGDAFVEFADEDWVRPEAQRLDEMRLVAQELRLEAELASGRAAQVVPELEALVAAHPLREAFVAHLMIALYRAGRHADALRAFQRHREGLGEDLGLDVTPSLRRLEERVLTHDPGLLLADAPAEALRGYRLGARLGTGQDGTVHAAHLPNVDRELVIRTIRPELADAPDFVRSFDAVAQRVAGLREHAVVPIHDYWREPGAAYVVMRRMHGGSLADRLERSDRDPLTAAEVTAIVQRIGGALAAAHAAGVVHGRVSPRSILFDDAGRASLADFDLGSASPCGPLADVQGLALVVRACLTHAQGDLASAIDEGMAGQVRSVDDLVSRLLDALAVDEVDGGAPPPNPYKGLRAFDEVDAADFCGRDALVEELLRRLGRPDADRLVLVVGGSGTGKSSVVRAGLLPRIRGGAVGGSERWFVTTMLPGAAPFKELAAALRSVAVADLEGVAGELARGGGIDTVVRRILPPGGELLLVIDQMEELFTSAPEREQRRFLDGLVHALSRPDTRLRVVGTLRADFYDRPLAVQPFGALVNGATVTVPAMSASELEACIVEPARRAGRQVDGPLVAELVAAALDEPAGLPALQFTLFELAERAPRDLTLAAYRELGGLSGAIASRAEELYLSLDDGERAAVRQLFGQLVVVPVDGEPTRRRAARGEVATDRAGLDALIDRWVDARLLTVDRHPQTRLPTVELAHEALLREWPRLHRWIDQDRESLLALGRLREAAASWVELDRDPGALYRGARLELALDTVGPSLAPQEREFLDASRDARDLEAVESAARAERQARANRRLRAQLVVIGIALVVALVGGFLAVDQRREAVEGRRLASARALAAAADANLDEDPERSLLLALEAVERSRDGDAALPEAIGALHEAIRRSRVVLTVPDVGGSLTWSPDGSIFVTEGPEDTGLIDLRDAETGESVRSWVGHRVDINEVAFDATGARIATTGDDGSLRVWDVETSDEVADLVGGGGRVSGPSFSPDGRHVAATWLEDGPIPEVRIFEVASGQQVSSYLSSSGWGRTAFSPDGRRLLVPVSTGVSVVDVATGREALVLGEGRAEATDARYSPSGRWVASAHADGTVRVWDVATGRQLFTAGGHRSQVNRVEWSGDGRRLATAGNDGTARVFDIVDGVATEVAVLSARDTASGLGGLALSADGDRVMTGDWALASVKVWDVSAQAGVELPLPSNVLFAEAGRAMVESAGGGVAWWDFATGEEVPVPEPEGVEGEAWLVEPSPDGELVLFGTDAGLSLHDATSGRLVRSLPNEHGLTWVTWSPDGEHLAYAQVVESDAHGVITVTDRSGRVLTEIVDKPGHFAREIAFVGDGRWLAEARHVPRLTPNAIGMRVWDWRAERSVLDVDGLAVQLAAEPSGDRIAFTKEQHDEVEIWDVRAGTQVRTVRGAGVVNSVSWSADGGRVALAGADGTVRIFDSSDGRLELILRGHAGGVHDAFFSADGSRLLSSGDEGVRLWALDLDELVSIARSRLTRDLDEDECRQYLRDVDCT